MIGSAITVLVLTVQAVSLGPGVQSSRATLRTSLDTAVIAIGDRVHLSVEVDHPSTERVVWPDSVQVHPFEILGARVGAPVASGDRLTSSLVLTLTAFELGDLELPSFDITVEGDSAYTLATDSWLVTVESIGLDESGDIRDVKSPLSLPRNWWLLWPWVVLPLAAAALGVWLYKRYRGRALPVEPVPDTPLRPPHELALEALDRLEASGLLGRGEYKAHYIEVADIVRTYFEGRFAIDAMEMVTDEVVAGLEDTGLEDEIVRAARSFLQACDLVKFAKHTPTPEASRSTLNAARALVERTRPNAEPRPAQASAA